MELIYTSRATRELGVDQLVEMLRAIRAKNERHGVTGILLHHEGSFLQVLEGEPEVLARLYVTIERDPRHDRVRLLRRRTLEARRFAEWAMGFASSPDAVRVILGGSSEPGFDDFLRTGRVEHFADPDAADVSSVLRAFRSGRFRSA